MQEHITLSCKYYRFNLDNDKELQPYEEVRAKAGKDWECFDAHAAPAYDQKARKHREGLQKLIESGSVTIETKCLFKNQFNTVGTEERSGYRVFGWYEYIFPNGKIKEGYYLVKSDELSAALDAQRICGHCGYRTEDEIDFCPSCLGSKYLKEEKLHLTQMLPVSRSNEKRPKLSGKTLAKRSDAFREAQAEQAEKDRAQQAERRLTLAQKLEDEFQPAVDSYAAELRKKTDAKIYVLRQGYDLDNLIYYSHTGRFCWGWRNSIPEEAAEELKVKLKDFPGLLDFKTH